MAIGDYDGDGRPDIFVVSKTESCRLFRNLGDYKFEDVTDKAGVGGPVAGGHQYAAAAVHPAAEWTYSEILVDRSALTAV